MLFRKLIFHLPNVDAAMGALMQSFNNPDSANSIIYHLRLLAASW